MARTRILVPLDGSPIAERALAEALTLAKALPAEVTFLQVVPPIEEVFRERAIMLAIDELWERQRDSAMDYLNRVRGLEWAAWCSPHAGARRSASDSSR
jgi:nucleotide-binding universal stress UspA family protein